MSKLGIMAALLATIWLTAAASNGGQSGGEPVIADSDELQGIELEHFQNGADPDGWGRILEMHEASLQEASDAAADVE